MNTLQAFHRQACAAQVATHVGVSSEDTRGQVHTEPMHDTCPTMFIRNLFSSLPPSAFVNGEQYYMQCSFTLVDLFVDLCLYLFVDHFVHLFLHLFVDLLKTWL